MRIIAGNMRGRTIEAPKGRDTRPTLDRVRESLFGILQFDLPGRRVLDLFAGSGSLGLEALSRGLRTPISATGIVAPSRPSTGILPTWAYRNRPSFSPCPTRQPSPCWPSGASKLSWCFWTLLCRGIV